MSQTGLLSRAVASNSCRESIELSKLSLDNTLYGKVAERQGCSSSSSSSSSYYYYYFSFTKTYYVKLI